MTRRRLLTIGHSYTVRLNRRLAAEMATVGAGRWDVTVAGPEYMRGDLRAISFEPDPDAELPTVPVPAYLTGRLQLMLYGRRARSLVRGGGWDLVHGWEEPYILAGGQLAGWAGRGRYVFYTYQNNRKRYPPPFDWVERRTVGRSVGWIAGGQTVAAAMAGRPGYDERPHAIIPLGVDTNAFRPDPAARADVLRRLSWSADGPPVVGYLGRFVPEKGLGLLTRALDAVSVGWRALLVGGGPMEADLRRWAARHPDRVRVVTGVPHDGVPAHLAAMDLLAAPSQTTPRWREQLGRMLLEAFAAGVPVVASDSGEIPHVVADAGRVVGEADDDGWVAALAELLDSPARRADLAARGRERAERVFAWPVIAARHLDFFDTLLDAPRL